MSGSHEKLPKIFWVQIVLALLIGIGYLIGPSSNHGEGASNAQISSASDNLAPIGKSVIKEVKVATAPRSGKEVYGASCAVCHNNGVANAPKLDDKAAWEPRVAEGLEALVQSAIKGKGGMPPRGGNPNISDEEMNAVVAYMLEKAGIDLKAKTAEPSAPAMEEKKPAIAATDTKKAEEVEAVATADVAREKKAEEPKVMHNKSAPKEEPKAVAVKQDAIKEKPEMTEKPVPAGTNEASTAIATTSVNTAKNEKGQQVYKAACSACHASGIAGSPKVGDVAAWVDRIAAGNDSLYNAAINGKGAMPAKGGSVHVSDEDIKAAVDYMTAQSQ